MCRRRSPITRARRSIAIRGQSHTTAAGIAAAGIPADTAARGMAEVATVAAPIRRAPRMDMRTNPRQRTATKRVLRRHRVMRSPTRKARAMAQAPVLRLAAGADVPRAAGKIVPVKMLRWLLLLLAALAGTAAWWAWDFRPGLPQEAAHRYASTPTANSLTATWFGVTAVLLADGEHAIFIDPFFTRPPGLLNMARNATIAPDEALIRQSLARANVKTLDAVLVSHSHFDHAMDAAVVARLTHARLAGSPSTANIGRGGGLPESMIDVVTPGEPRQYGSFRVTFIASQHAGASGGRPTGDITAPLSPPATYLDYKQGGTYSILVEHAQGSLLHHGSAGFVPGALNGRHADVVFLGVALLPDLDGYLANVVDAVGAHRVIPVHWDDFTRPLSQPLTPMPVAVRLDRFFDGMSRRPDLSVQTLAPGVPAALF